MNAHDLKRLLDVSLTINSYAGHDDDCPHLPCECGYSQAAERFLSEAEAAVKQLGVLASADAIANTDAELGPGRK
jgi:hypothetical protein